MKTEYLTGEELARMQKEKGNTCISIIVPTHRLSPDRMVDHLEVKKAVEKAIQYLEYKFDKDVVKPLALSLDELYDSIDFNHNAEGIGLFVSPNIKQLISFFFPVKEKLVVSDSFETRDLLLQAYFSRPYFTLLLNENEAKIFEGRINTLEELSDTHFPRKFEDNYEYSHPVRGSSYTGNAFMKDFERDKSQLEEMRFGSFLEQIDDTLNSYLVNDTLLIVTGTKKDLAYFKQITNHSRNMAGSITGNYSYTPVTELAARSWDVLKSFIEKERNDKISEFIEKIGEGRGITGIVNIWKAAKEGKALTLLVEKDFSLPGFLLKDDDFNLHLHPPDKPHHILPDAVNVLMDLVFEMKGEVIVVDNEALVDYERIALITRY